MVSRRMIKTEASVMISVIKIEFRISPQGLHSNKLVLHSASYVLKHKLGGAGETTGHSQVSESV